MIWLSASIAVFAFFVVLTLAQGGHFHRTPTCGGSEANIYETAIHAAGCGLIAWLAFWALGAEVVRCVGHDWRWSSPLAT